MPYLNLSSPDAKLHVRALHENLEHAISCLGALQQPMMSTDRILPEDEAMAMEQFDKEMFEAIELIIEAFYGNYADEGDGGNGSKFVFRIMERKE